MQKQNHVPPKEWQLLKKAVIESQRFVDGIPSDNKPITVDELYRRSYKNIFLPELSIRTNDVYSESPSLPTLLKMAVVICGSRWCCWWRCYMYMTIDINYVHFFKVDADFWKNMPSKILLLENRNNSCG